VAREVSDWLRSPQRRQRDIRYVMMLTPLTLPAEAAALAIARTADGSHPIFRQSRRGRDGRPFIIYKIRSQSRPSVNTSVGRVLRFTGLDEFPQFYNVLRGDVSLFGPRPLIESDVEEMQQALPGKVFRQWIDAYDHAGPGCLSSFCHFARRRGRTVERHALLAARAVLDTKDVKLSSPSYERALLWEIGPTALHMLRYPADALY
jgi:hypothetical protein